MQDYDYAPLMISAADLLNGKVFISANELDVTTCEVPIKGRDIRMRKELLLVVETKQLFCHSDIASEHVHSSSLKSDLWRSKNPSIKSSSPGHGHPARRWSERGELAGNWGHSTFSDAGADVRAGVGPGGVMGQKSMQA